jgi:hypothetical protein
MASLETSLLKPCWLKNLAREIMGFAAAGHASTRRSAMLADAVTVQELHNEAPCGNEPMIIGADRWAPDGAKGASDRGLDPS